MSIRLHRMPPGVAATGGSTVGRWIPALMVCMLSYTTSAAQEVRQTRPASGLHAEPLSELKDSDGDQVTDAQDMCPGTTKGWAADHNGCPLPLGLEPAAHRMPAKVTFDSSIMFESGSAQVTPRGVALLHEVASGLKAAPPAGQRWDIQVVGHADVMGNVHRNTLLSQARADAVRAQFIAAGVPAGLMVATGRGSQDSIVECPESMMRAERVDCLAPNRRVEVDLKLVPVAR